MLSRSRRAEPSGPRSGYARVPVRPTSFLVAGLFVVGCATHRGTMIVGPATTELEGFTTEQREILETTFATIRDLEVEELAIDESEYGANTTFARTFGFALDGPALLAWWSRRVSRIRVDDAWTVAVYDGDHTIAVTPEFFGLDPLERIYALVHEARHADGDGYRHDDCPPMPASSRQPNVTLTGAPACDLRPDGAYAFQAALLFELYAYGLVDPAAARVAWASTKRRIMAPR